ncbi:hypothetical protein Tco_0748027 [Tanacetum coccineum]|uniref:Uncharacterized protein n=1 Tax=Tanacetum coccineum TaxID=301880 RepID=A0ABQ4YVC4_9ASTR
MSAESDQDNLSINAQSTEVDAPPVNDDNANANEDNADFINNEDDVVAHVLDDDDVVVSDDDEVNPSTNVEEMALFSSRSHGGDAGGSPSQSVRRCVLDVKCVHKEGTFRHINQPTFDAWPLITMILLHSHPIGDYASMLNSLMGETIRPLPLACVVGEIPRRLKALFSPTLESYFNLIEIVVPSDNHQNMSGMGRKLPGGGSTSRRRANQAFADVMTREQMTQILRQKEQER